VSASTAPTAPLPDARHRELAISTFDQTVVVEAGAGTGKTALLTSRILAILMHPGPAAAEITEIAAITFTKRAAGEMSVRIRQALTSFIGWSRQSQQNQLQTSASDQVFQAYQRASENLSTNEILQRSSLALEQLETARITTMHSFAGGLLREHPGAAGVDPSFSEDDGTECQRMLKLSWRRFCARELGQNAPNADSWLQVLQQLSMEQLATLAAQLADESTDLAAFESQLASGKIFQPDQTWLQQLLQTARDLFAAHDNSEKLIPGKVLATVILSLEELLAGQATLSKEDQELLGKNPSKSQTWAAGEIAEIKRLQAITLPLLTGEEFREVIISAIKLLLPFAHQFRDEFVRAGFISFSGLLIRARNLLRDRPDIRAPIKKRYRHILVDEFQDTDPLQYEIVYFLCESPKSSAEDWRQLKLQPGKLFIVGDPKQSIYSFRGADINAYSQVVDTDLDSRCLKLRLETNFRSCRPILDAVNLLFSKIIRSQKGLQPEYQPLLPPPQQASARPIENVEIHLARKHNGQPFAYAAEAVAGEAASLARWLSQKVIGHAEIAPGKLVRAADVAILLRVMTNVEEYVAACRNEDLPLVVEGQKSFFTTEEIKTFLNLLSVIVDPLDATALCGLLRSPLGGITDRDLALLARADALSICWASKIPDDISEAPTLRKLFSKLLELRTETAGLTLPAAIDRLLGELPILEMAAAMGGEGAAANIERVRQMAARDATNGDIGLREFVSTLGRNASELSDEGENPLAEEGQDAIKIFTIHKAKGLEFPIVILAGLHCGLRKQEDNIRLHHDWSSGRCGLSLGNIKTPEALRQESLRSARADTEERRVFYVGATRARQKLVLSAAEIINNRGKTGWAMNFLEETGQLDSSNSSARKVCQLRLLEAPDQKNRSEPAPPKPPGKALLKSWQKLEEQRIARRLLAEATSPLLRPSATHDDLQAQAEEIMEGETHLPLTGRLREHSMLLGTLAHAVMEYLDFESAPASLPATIERVLTEHAMDVGDQQQELGDELSAMLKNFIVSTTFAELRDAEILARELPCLLPWTQHHGHQPAAAEGIIDLLLEFEGNTIIADYKTDRVSPEKAAGHAQQYLSQGKIYAQAVRKASGRSVNIFKIIFLRPCITVDLEI
jgi:ATP-dependent helicase/nuclease subunit A